MISIRSFRFNRDRAHARHACSTHRERLGTRARTEPTLTQLVQAVPAPVAPQARPGRDRFAGSVVDRTHLVQDQEWIEVVQT
jgi:hypothetical protein